MRRGPKGLGVFFIVAASTLILPACAGVQTVGSHEVSTFAPMLERVLPATVSLAVRGHLPAEGDPLYTDPQFREPFGVPAPPEFVAAGAGVIVDEMRGYVLTTGHVVEGAEEIIVRLHDGRRLSGETVDSDPAVDLALLRIPAERLTSLPLGDSDRLRVGDFVVAIGNPFGLMQTVTSGIVSAVGRSEPGREGYGNFIQTDASINPGDSGGALVNLRGELVGVISAIVGPYGANVGIGLAIPVNVARQAMARFIAICDRHTERPCAPIPKRHEQEACSGPVIAMKWQGILVFELGPGGRGEADVEDSLPRSSSALFRYMGPLNAFRAQTGQGDLGVNQSVLTDWILPVREVVL